MWSLRIVMMISVVAVGGPVLFASGGYLWGQYDAAQQPNLLVQAWQQEMVLQRQEISETRRGANENLDALALNLGRLQAHVIRLDALGERLTTMADLDHGEFDFSGPPAVGGPSPGKNHQSMNIDDFVGAIEQLRYQLEDRDQQLALLETMMMNQSLQERVHPAGRPINKGWISSFFGMRNDPFTGKREYHRGVDFAGKHGSDVIAVASGVVTWAGDRYGYGKLVELNHGNGYATRYGHNDSLNVEIGDAIKKGQVLAKMGSSGRSTGPHVHFEVLRGGKAVNPRKYIIANN